ncbi:hypothetical protein C8F04DRAFT_1258980 [Mycena alexandri]|uniref:Ribonuclease H1 N-terminal domain-containing protein n=1 Tax=Mycena alexandri TaxID=1745969 RepID=A0AAD6SX47_9AGAR|nr:hypothetical protein C8F04DRAFT_1258980 [Mycena alexandri]
MTALSQTARQYTDDEFETLIANLDDLHLATVQTGPRPRTPPPPPLPPNYSPPVPTTPARPNSRVYQFQTPTRSGRTREWSEASHHTQGVPHALVRTIQSPTTPRTKKRGAYTVFYGRQPGVFKHWFGVGGAQVQVTGVPSAVHQGYATVAEAEAAFNYALERSWVAVRGSRPPSPSELPQTAIPTLPLPQDLTVSIHNPLHGASPSTPKWYIVYTGISPGIYASYLECALNTLGLSSARYDSADSREEAERRWAVAVAGTNVNIVTPRYATQ